MESVGFALQALGITDYKHAFIIEKDLSCRKFVAANFDIEHVYEDITQACGGLVTPTCGSLVCAK